MNLGSITTFVFVIILCYFPPPIFSIQYSSFTKLQLPGTVTSPESLAFDVFSQGPYTGVSDGRVLKYEAPSGAFVNFAITSPNRSAQLCDGTSDINLGPTCGLPKGLGFNYRTGELYITDPFIGLTVVGRNGGLATTLATSAGGQPFHLLVGLAVDPLTGLVYFTDASSIYGPKDAAKSIATDDSTARLLRYDPMTKQVEVLLTGLAGAVGVETNGDGMYVLVSEYNGKRIQKYWFKGPKANTAEVLITFQGNPNKVKTNMLGDFWVALNIQTQQASTPMIKPVALKINGMGTVLETVDLSLQYNQSITVVEEQLGSLYVGSLTADYVGVYKFV